MIDKLLTMMFGSKHEREAKRLLVGKRAARESSRPQNSRDESSGSEGARSPHSLNAEARR